MFDPVVVAVPAVVVSEVEDSVPVEGDSEVAVVVPVEVEHRADGKMAAE